jgi:hypothetical protein
MHALLNVIKPFPELDEPSHFGSSPFDNLRRVRLDNEGKSAGSNVVFLDAGGSENSEALSEEPATNWEALIEQARQEERAAAELRLQEALEAQRSEFVEITKAQRDHWVREESDVLAQKLEKEFSLLEHELGDKIGGVLAGFVASAFKGQALSEMAELLAALMGDSERPLVRVSGPQDLIEALQAKAGELTGSVEFVFADQPDISIVADDAHIETQISAWAERLSKLNDVA